MNVLSKVLPTFSLLHKVNEIWESESNSETWTILDVHSRIWVLSLQLFLQPVQSADRAVCSHFKPSNLTQQLSSLWWKKHRKSSHKPDAQTTVCWCHQAEVGLMVTHASLEPGSRCCVLDLRWSLELFTCAVWAPQQLDSPAKLQAYHMTALRHTAPVHPKNVSPFCYLVCGN